MFCSLGVQSQHEQEVWMKVELQHQKNQPYAQVGNEMLKLIIEGIQNQEIQPYQFSWKGNVGEKMDLKRFNQVITNSDTQKTYLMPQLALVYLIKTTGSGESSLIRKVSLAIVKGASSRVSLGPLFYADLEFSELSRFLDAKFKENPVKYAWINPLDSQQKMSYAAALRAGKYWGTIDKTFPR